ncbi:hypothetical protein EVAR_51900_1 [Eumeta japonica]|uniref:Uncharacterized protein n=1 Tax=Eumeta variegata TaxID=151549 RepID=A0A4C1XJH4_EUMVA|nr:hypothetical protein EVAR_51900_1 [Eumeta japonica]
MDHTQIFYISYAYPMGRVGRLLQGHSRFKMLVVECGVEAKADTEEFLPEGDTGVLNVVGPVPYKMDQLISKLKTVGCIDSKGPDIRCEIRKGASKERII